MKIKDVINNYIECNNFEIKIINKKVKIYYYSKIEDFSSSMIKIMDNDNFIKIKGDNLVIETMFKEYIVISGKIKSIELGYKYE